MKEFYENIEKFIEDSSVSDYKIKEAINLHHNIDVFVKKLQILKEYVELLEDEILFFSKKEETDDSVFAIELFRKIQNELLGLENKMYSEKFLNDTDYSSKLINIKTLIDEHVEKMYKIGEKLRETDILKNNLGG